MTQLAGFTPLGPCCSLSSVFTVIIKKMNCSLSPGVPQLVLLTKVDEACELVASDVSNVYKSRFIEGKVRRTLSGLK